MDSVTLPQLEQAINYWRNLTPSAGEDHRLCPEASALATPYALMIMSHRRELPTVELDARPRGAADLGSRPEVNVNGAGRRARRSDGCAGAVARHGPDQPLSSAWMSCTRASTPMLLLASTRDSPLPSNR